MARQMGLSPEISTSMKVKDTRQIDLLHEKFFICDSSQEHQDKSSPALTDEERRFAIDMN